MCVIRSLQNAKFDCSTVRSGSLQLVRGKLREHFSVLPLISNGNCGKCQMPPAPITDAPPRLPPLTPIFVFTLLMIAFYLNIFLPCVFL